MRGVPSLFGMKEWLRILGHSESDIDNQPISEDLFTQYFFEVWEGLASLGLGQDVETTKQPRYRQCLALLAFHVFIRENVDAAIFETHHGGEYDVTNVIQRPTVTGITSLGMDHVRQLGPTLKNIAWHKAGIFKAEAPAFSVPQEAGLMEVLCDRAAEKKTTLTIVPPDNCLSADIGVLSIPVQRLNSSLALALASMFLQLKAPGHAMSSEDIDRGIDNFSWAGRFEIIEEGTSQWFVDGAHNDMSLKQAAQWFSNNINVLNPRRCCVLIFSHLSKERDGVSLMKCLAHALLEYNVRPDHVIFTTNQVGMDESTRTGK
ncbi:hypothetical protein E8E15_000118 [Penicillium rubens]|nr:hypothetical protein E8E15_000118 [Penicillium rubens]